MFLTYVLAMFLPRGPPVDAPSPGPSGRMLLCGLHGTVALHGCPCDLYCWCCHHPLVAKGQLENAAKPVMADEVP